MLHVHCMTVHRIAVYGDTIDGIGSLCRQIGNGEVGVWVALRVELAEGFGVVHC